MNPSSTSGGRDSCKIASQPLLRMPYEILQLIASHLPYSAQFALKLTCRHLHNMAPTDWHGISIDDYFTNHVDQITYPAGGIWVPASRVQISPQISPAQYLPQKWLQRLELSLIADWPGFEQYQLCYGCEKPRLKHLSRFPDWGVLRQRGKTPQLRKHSHERYEALQACFNHYLRATQDRAYINHNRDHGHPSGIRRNSYDASLPSFDHVLRTRYGILFPKKQQRLCHDCLCMTYNTQCKTCSAWCCHVGFTSDAKFRRPFEAVCNDCGLSSEHEIVRTPEFCHLCLTSGVDDRSLDNTAKLRASMFEENDSEAHEYARSNLQT